MMWKIALTFLAALLAVGLGQVPGGVSDIDVNDPGFQQAVNFAVEQYNAHTNHRHYYALVQVLKAQVQVVRGIKYIMTLLLGKTTCIKGVLSVDCPIIRDPPEAKFYTCSFTVWAWYTDFYLLGSSCRNDPNSQ